MTLDEQQELAIKLCRIGWAKHKETGELDRAHTFNSAGAAWMLLVRTAQDDLQFISVDEYEEPTEKEILMQKLK